MPSRVTASAITTCGAPSGPSLAWPRRRTPAAVLVLLVDGEPGGRRVVEDQVDIELEEVGRPEEHLLLDRLGLRRQDIEGAIELIDLEPLRLGQPGDIRQPTLGASELRGGIVQPVRRHREQGRLVGRAQPGRLEPPADRLADAELLPQGPRHQHHTELEHPLDLDLRQPPRGLAAGLFGAEHAVDALDQPLQRLAVERVGAAEAVDDARLGALGRGVPDVLGEPVVGDGRAVPVAPFGDPQVHAQCMGV